MSDSVKNSAAKNGLVLGIFSLICWIVPLAGFPVSIVGLVQSIRGQKSDNKSKATAGLVLNIIGLVATIVNSSIGAFMGVTN